MKSAVKTVIIAAIGLLLVGCTQPASEPTPDLAATVRNAVAEAIPPQPAQVDVEATARAVVLESLPTPVGQPDTEATVRAVLQEEMPGTSNLPDIEATARAVVNESERQTADPPNTEATVRAVMQETTLGSGDLPNVDATARAVVEGIVQQASEFPNVEATARSVMSEELPKAVQSQSSSGVDGSELRVTVQFLVAVRRDNDNDVPISISDLLIQNTKFKDHDDLPSELRIHYGNLLGMWFNNEALMQWIEGRVGTTSANGYCCYYLNVDEPGLYRAAILDLPELTQLINEAEELGIDSSYLAEALQRIQDGYTIVYESFTW